MMDRARVIRQRLGVLAAAVFIASCGFTAPANAQSSDHNDVTAHLDDNEDEVALAGVSSRANDGASVSAGGVVTQVAWTPTCAQNTPETASDMCAAAALSCPQSITEPQIQMWQWTRRWNQVASRAASEWRIVRTTCVTASNPVENVHALVLRLFQDRVKLMKAPLHIQPPNGRTLVNLDTIFWTVDPTRTFGDIPVLSHSVDLRILPTSYAWHFGDGNTSETGIPGGPYPNKDVTHQYLGTGAVRPSLAVTYRGQYRVDDGAWIDMVGTATVDGPEVALTVVETRAQLIGG